MTEKSIQSRQLPSIVEFNRPQKYRAIRRLGSGACGETVHIYDDEIECDFVAKKFAPIVSRNEDPKLFLELMNRFKQEAKLLFRLSHPGIVRVYNYFDYPESDTAFILMEMIDGLNIIEYLTINPTHLERLLEEAVEAFIHLEKKAFCIVILGPIIYLSMRKVSSRLSTLALVKTLHNRQTPVVRASI